MKTDPLVLHDSFLFPDGGGRVAISLAQAFNARLGAGQLEKGNFPKGYFHGTQIESLQAYNSTPFFLKPSKIAQMWYAFSHMPLQHLKWTIFSGSLCPLAHKRFPNPKILYCHTPPRLLYDQRNFYLSHINSIKRPGIITIMSFYQRAYEKALRDMSIILANSRNVQKRIKQYLGMNSLIVYPPCNTSEFKWLGQKNYYLSTARPDFLKRVDIIISAFQKMPDQHLIVVSGGNELERLRNMAQDTTNIHILGWVTENKLKQLIGNCIATIYIPKDEDFGLSPVESMAAGKPVIGVAEGGLLETVIEGETGILISPSNCSDDLVSSLIDAIRQMSPGNAQEMRRSCEIQASKFQTEIFLDKIKTIIDQL